MTLLLLVEHIDSELHILGNKIFFDVHNDNYSDGFKLLFHVVYLHVHNSCRK